jgi:hypothetical protein
LIQAKLSSGLSAHEMSCDACYADVGNGDLHSLESSPDGSTKSKDSVPPIAPTFPATAQY